MDIMLLKYNKRGIMTGPDLFVITNFWQICAFLGTIIYIYRCLKIGFRLGLYLSRFEFLTSRLWVQGVLSFDYLDKILACSPGEKLQEQEISPIPWAGRNVK